MNKKILIGCVVAVVILLLMSFTSVVGVNNTKSIEKKRVSPLFTIRTRLAINSNAEEVKDEIETSYLNERLFLIKSIFNFFQNLRFGRNKDSPISVDTTGCTWCGKICDNINTNRCLQQQLELKTATCPLTANTLCPPYCRNNIAYD